MDGGSGGALVVGAVAVGALLRFVVRVDRYDRSRARRPQPARLVPRSPLLAEPRPRQPEPEPQDERPPLVEVPDRLFVRAARIAVELSEVDAGTLERRMPVIPAMAERLMSALAGRGVVSERDEAGRARVLVRPGDLPELLTRWGIVEDEASRRS